MSTVTVDGALTTNDVRVLRLLVEKGPLSVHALERLVGRHRCDAAIRRLPRLQARQLAVYESASATYDVSGAGVRALHAAEQPWS